MRIEHAAMWTTDLEGMRAFYETYFTGRAGPKYRNDAKGFASYFLEFDGGARLELMHAADGSATTRGRLGQTLGLGHLAFSVGSEEAVRELTERLRRSGFEVVSQPRQTGDGYFESCVLDPEGNQVEIAT